MAIRKPAAFVAGTKPDAMILKNMKRALSGKKMESTDLQMKLADAKKERRKEEAMAIWSWVEVWDPTSESFYYWDQHTHEITWEKPHNYILAAGATSPSPHYIQFLNSKLNLMALPSALLTSHPR